MLRVHKPVKRVVPTVHHGDLVCILAKEGIYYRERGRKKCFLIPHGVAYQRAVAISLACARDAKKAARVSRSTRGSHATARHTA